MAEGKGFEPPEGVSSFNDLANRRLQPLGHPSAIMGIWGCPQHGVCTFHLTKDERFVKPWIARNCKGWHDIVNYPSYLASMLDFIYYFM